MVPAFEVSYNSKQLRIVDNTKGINRGKDAVCTDLETCWFKYCFVHVLKKIDISLWFLTTKPNCCHV